MLNVQSQCKGFTKRNCLPALSPYMSNGQLNAAQLKPGESADLKLNFNQGLSYRIVICSDAYLGDVRYKIYDESGTTFFNDTIFEKHSIKDIKVSQTTLLNLSLETPKIENTTDITGSGCVSILIGFKE